MGLFGKVKGMAGKPLKGGKPPKLPGIGKPPGMPGGAKGGLGKRPGAMSRPGRMGRIGPKSPF